MKKVTKKEYEHIAIEKKWQKEWTKKKAFKTQDSSRKKKFYVLDMFPYPSGEGLHVGHPKGYIATDIISRMKRMQGFNVLHPMGFDAFGLPAENYAIKTGTNPMVSVSKNVSNFKKQLEKVGLDYDWSREVNTTDPNFYKWTQWIFLKLYEKGLAYESNEPVNWCPVDKTVLANEDVEGGKCERCGAVVIKKPIRQWVLRITDYADRLLSDLNTLDWPESIKESQRNWIGKSIGAEIDFDVWRTSEKITVFTTRADTIFGATYVVLSPEHELVEKLWPLIENKDEIKQYALSIKNKTEIDRTRDDKEKTGVLLKGIHAVNPATNEKISIWIADYVLPSYGTGAIMAVPAHDERDGEFAKKYNLPIKEVVKDDILLNSDRFTGYNTEKARFEITRFVKGKFVTKYKLRDWVFSRQRYWGEPIPVLRGKDGIIPVKEKDLPVKLPKVKSYEPTGEAESPLANIKSWMNVRVGKEKYLRESNTMPQWAGSSWYYLRYMDPKNKKFLVDKKKEKYWNTVDLYVGGAEHATRHLIYARFWHKFLYDIGVVSTKEPFHRLQNVGLIIASDGRKMSKRFGNVINPDDIIKHYGADTLRMYEMFMGPFEQSVSWNEDNIFGVRRFLERVWRISAKVKNGAKVDSKFQILLNKTIKKVTEDIETMSFNTSVSSMMILLNEMEKFEEINKKDFESFLKILSPFAPHISEELWANLGYKKLLCLENWPKPDPKKLEELEVKMAVQINGKVRGEVLVTFEENEQDIVDKAKLAPGIDKWLLGKNILKVVFVKNRLVNFVTN
ncbi:MAG TPA: leucine--tRNA ligase [Parcubacteria group bacterium]|jgi:leucyl-tRNA synthetase|nr:leucine--tRNA ligase [Parcubacteria group bacterium]